MLKVFSDYFTTIIVFDKIAYSLATQTTLETIEISECELHAFSSASAIKKIINCHNSRRNETLWITGLRSEDHTKVRGLLELVLRNNQISDSFMKDILPILGFDQYLKVIAFMNLLLQERLINK